MRVRRIRSSPADRRSKPIAASEQVGLEEWMFRNQDNLKRFGLGPRRGRNVVIWRVELLSSGELDFAWLYIF